MQVEEPLLCVVCVQRLSRGSVRATEGSFSLFVVALEWVQCDGLLRWSDDSVCVAVAGSTWRRVATFCERQGGAGEMGHVGWCGWLLWALMLFGCGSAQVPSLFFSSISCSLMSTNSFALGQTVPPGAALFVALGTMLQGTVVVQDDGGNSFTLIADQFVGANASNQRVLLYYSPQLTAASNRIIVPLSDYDVYLLAYVPGVLGLAGPPALSEGISDGSGSVSLPQAVFSNVTNLFAIQYARNSGSFGLFFDSVLSLTRSQWQRAQTLPLYGEPRVQIAAYGPTLSFLIQRRLLEDFDPELAHRMRCRWRCFPLLSLYSPLHQTRCVEFCQAVSWSGQERSSSQMLLQQSSST